MKVIKLQIQKAPQCPRDCHVKLVEELKAKKKRDTISGKTVDTVKEFGSIIIKEIFVINSNIVAQKVDNSLIWSL